MKHTYLVTGMSCNGCRSHVEETLSNVEGVISVDVDLKNAKASIEMEGHIPIEKFQEALQKDGGRYGIHAPGHQPKPEKKEDKPISNGTGTYYCPMQ